MPMQRFGSGHAWNGRRGASAALGAMALLFAAACGDGAVRQARAGAAPAAATPAGQAAPILRLPTPAIAPVEQHQQPAAPAPAAAGTPAAGTAATVTSSADPDMSQAHVVPPNSSEEMARKRAEWAEHERQVAQADADLQAWRRARKAEGAAIPHIGVSPQAERDAVAVELQGWYRHYSTRSAAVTLALSRFGLAAGAVPEDPRRLLAACTDLSEAAEGILADHTALAAPVASVASPLTTAYTEIRAAADACIRGRAEDRAAHLAAAHVAMGEAGAALRPYNLNP